MYMYAYMCICICICVRRRRAQTWTPSGSRCKPRACGPTQYISSSFCRCVHMYMCTCICVHVYVYICVYMCIYIGVCQCVYVSIRMRICVYVYMYTYMYLYVSMWRRRRAGTWGRSGSKLLTSGPPRYIPCCNVVKYGALSFGVFNVRVRVCNMRNVVWCMQHTECCGLVINSITVFITGLHAPVV